MIFSPSAAFLFIANNLGPNHLRKAKQSPPQIAYKAAVLEPLGSPTQFYGVSGISGYDSPATAPLGSLGFHAYDTLDQAYSHKQLNTTTRDANVLLEVLLSGHVHRMEMGFIAREQRVLQIIPHLCNICYRDAPTHFLLSATGDTPFFLCSTHTAYKLEMLRRGPVSRFFKPQPASEVNIFPVGELPAFFPWMRDQNIVVASLSGPNSFVPTKIP